MSDDNVVHMNPHNRNAVEDVRVDVADYLRSMATKIDEGDIEPVEHCLLLLTSNFGDLRMFSPNQIRRDTAVGILTMGATRTSYDEDWDE